METFNPLKLRWLRESRSVSMSQLAARLQISAAQVHRLETGQRRLTVDSLIQYCRALNADPNHLLFAPTRVPVIGLVDSEHEITVLAQKDWESTAAPYIVPDMENVAAMRWVPTGRFRPMLGHLLFVYHHEDGVSELAWGKRCLIERDDGSQRLGWPIREGNSTHIDGVEGRSEFNVPITRATPLLAVVPPFVIERIERQLGAIDGRADVP